VYGDDSTVNNIIKVSRRRRKQSCEDRWQRGGIFVVDWASVWFAAVARKRRHKEPSLSRCLCSAATGRDAASRRRVLPSCRAGRQSRYARGVAACDKETRGKHEGAIFSLIIVSITIGRTSWVPLQAESLRPQALYLVTKRVNFLSESRVLGFPRIGAAQFFQRFFNGEFGCFSHGKPSYPGDKRSDNGVTPSVEIGAGQLRRQSRPDGLKLPLPSARLITSDPTQASVDLDQHQLCSADLLYAQCALRAKSGRLSPQRGARRLLHGRVIAGRQPCIKWLATLRQTPPMNVRPVALFMAPIHVGDLMRELAHL
jgi:hypothetical protein